MCTSRTSVADIVYTAVSVKKDQAICVQLAEPNNYGWRIIIVLYVE